MERDWFDWIPLAFLPISEKSPGPLLIFAVRERKRESFRGRKICENLGEGKREESGEEMVGLFSWWLRPRLWCLFLKKIWSTAVIRLGWHVASQPFIFYQQGHFIAGPCLLKYVLVLFYIIAAIFCFFWVTANFIWEIIITIVICFVNCLNTIWFFMFIS